jgi:hypothetical protein
MIALIDSKRYENTLNTGDDLEFVVSHYKSIGIPDVAKRYDLHDLALDILSEATNITETPPKLERKRKRSKSKVTPESGRASQQHEDTSRSYSRNTPKRVHLNECLALPRQTSRTSCEQDSLSGLTQVSDGPVQQINQISFHPLLTESHSEAQDYDQPIREPCPPCDTIRLDSTLETSRHANPLVGLAHDEESFENTATSSLSQLDQTANTRPRMGGFQSNGSRLSSPNSVPGDSTWHNYVGNTTFQLHPYRPGSFDTSFVHPNTPYQPRQHASSTVIGLNEGENNGNSAMPITSHQPITTYMYQDPMSQQTRDIGGAGIIMPGTFYHPGSFSASHVYPSTPYRPMQTTDDSNYDQHAQRNYASSTTPVASYEPDSFTTNEVRPDTPYQPVRSTSDVTCVLGLPPEPFNSTLIDSIRLPGLVV